MRVIFLTSRLPFPPEGGDRFRVFHQIRTVAEAGHEVHLISFDTGRPEPTTIAPLTRLLASSRIVELPKLLSAFRSAQALPGRQPLQAAYYRSSRMRAQVGRALERIHPDVVVTHLFRMAPYALERMEAGRPRWILDLTDVISAGIERSLPYRRGPDRWLYQEERRRIERYESETAPRFDECWVISDTERGHLSRLAPGAAIRVVPNGLVPEPFLVPFRPSEPKDPARLLFFGFYEVFHNRDAIRYLVQEIFPQVRARVPEATLDITGKGAEALDRCRWARTSGVRVVGYVPRLEEAFERASVFVAPHRFAAGVQNKVVLALASGMPVVSTPAVRSGLEPFPADAMRVGETAEEIAAHVVDLIHDPGTAAALGARGRDWARATFTWRQTLQALELHGPASRIARAEQPLAAAGV